MKTRLELHEKLLEIKGNDEVYYQSPGRRSMSYPSIIYTKKRMFSNNANNIKYINNVGYDITVISQLPDSPLIDEILKLPHTRFSNHYEKDNLNHDVITIIL